VVDSVVIIVSQIKAKTNRMKKNEILGLVRDQITKKNKQTAKKL